MRFKCGRGGPFKGCDCVLLSGGQPDLNRAQQAFSIDLFVLPFESEGHHAERVVVEGALRFGWEPLAIASYNRFCTEPTQPVP